MEMHFAASVRWKHPHKIEMARLLLRETSCSKSLFYCAPSGARFQQVKVLNPPGSGKDIAEGKGVHREMESEGSWIWGTY